MPPLTVAAYNARIAQLSSSSGTGTASQATSVTSSADASPSGSSPTSSMSSVKPPPIPSTVASEVPSDLVALARELKAGIAAARELKSAQIGFKDFRLGTSLKTDGTPKGTTGCKLAEDFSPSANPSMSEQTLAASRARWWPIVGDLKVCTATTTVFEKQASVTYYTLGADEVIAKIILKAANADLPGITAALSKTLGAPKESSKTKSGNEVREEVRKAAREECDNPNIPMPPQKLQQCYDTVEYRTGLRMQMLPPDGIVATNRMWSPQGAQVVYTQVNTIDPTEVVFFASSLINPQQQVVDGLTKDIGSQNDKARKAEEEKKAKDF